MPGQLRGEPFSVFRDGKRVHFIGSQGMHWTIDPDRFDGDASVHLRTDPERISLVLRNARLPNTDLAASFKSEIRKAGAGWQIELVTDSGIKASADFLSFLKGATPARGVWNGKGLRAFDEFALRFDETPEVAFWPNWSIDAWGLARARLGEFHSSLVSRSWHLEIADGESIGGDADGGRTLFTVERGEPGWDLDLNHVSSEGWNLSHEDDLFNTLEVESASGPSGIRRTALFSQVGDSTANLRIHPGGGFIGDSGEPFHFELEKPRLAVALESKASGTALVAQVSTAPVWAHGAGISLLMAGGGSTPHFEWIDEGNGDNATPRLSPVALSATFASEDETQFLMNFTEKRPFEFTWANFIQPIECGLAHIHLLPGEHNLSFDLTCGDELKVLRPKDLLNLTFRFENLRLDTGNFAPDIVLHRRTTGNPRPTMPPMVGDQGCPPVQAHLHCPSTGGPPKITVIFPPQHVAEQAIYENPPGTFQGDIDLPDSDLVKVLPAGTSVPLTPVQRIQAKIILDPNCHPDVDHLSDQDLASVLPTHPPVPLTPAQRLQAKMILDPNYNAVNQPFTGPILGSRISGPSQLVFTMDEQDLLIPFTTEGLLDWSNWTPVLDPLATFDSASEPPASSPAPVEGRPPQGVTSLELPWRLNISPGQTARWAHTGTLKEADRNIYELWHTRLGSYALDKNKKPIVNETSNDQTIRAIWSPDFRNLTGVFPKHDPTKPFLMSLDQSDRNEIVHLTANFQIDDPKGFRPAAVPVEQLILSPMGGWLKSYGKWDPPQARLPSAARQIFTLEQWKHSATMGRDHYVRVVYKGFLLPFGHRASLIKITERKFDYDPNHNLYAYLHQRMFIVVQNPRRDYPVLGQKYSGRQFHYTRVDAVTTVTPTLNYPPDQTCFWVIAGGDTKPFPMRFRFWDSAGNISEADVGVVFADAAVSGDPVRVGGATDMYNNGKPGATASSFNGQKQGFAPSVKPGDTQYEVQSISWEADLAQGVTADQLYLNDLPCFVPLVNSASISSSSVSHVTQTTTFVKVHFYQPYLDNAFDPKTNRGEAFLELADGETLTLDFSTGGRGDQAGALATPNTGIVGFSRKAGPVGGKTTKPTPTAPSSLDGWASGVFAAPDFFGELTSAKILGGIKLSDIIALISPGLASNLENAPMMLEQSLFTDLGLDPSTLESLEEQIVDQIDNTVPPSINRKLGAQKGAVDSNFASVSADPSNPLTHAALFGAIAQYADALKNLVENPDELLDAVWAALRDYFLNTFAPGLTAAVTAFLTANVLDPVAADLDNAATALNTLFQNAAASANATFNELKAQLPDFASYADLIPIVADLQKRVSAFSTAAGSSPSDNQIPALLQQLGGIFDDLLQIFERLGYLDPATILTISNAVVSAEQSVYTAFGGVLATTNSAFTIAKTSLDQLEDTCISIAAGIQDQPGQSGQSVAQAFLQTLRQIQNSAQWLIDQNPNSTVANWRGQPYTPLLQAQIFSMQTQLLTAVQSLYATPGLASAPAAPALVSQTVDVAKGLTLVEYLYATQRVEAAYSPVLDQVVGVADSLRTRLTDLVAPGSTLDKLRQEIAAAPANSAAQMMLQIQHFTASLQYRAPLAVVPEINLLADPALKALITTALQQCAPLATSINNVAKALNTANAGLIKQLSDAYSGLTANLSSNLSNLLSAVLTPLSAAFMQVETYASDVLQKAQQISQALSALDTRLQQSVAVIAADIPTAQGALDLLTTLIPIPKSVTLSYSFHPTLKNFEPVFYLNDNADFTITAQTTIPLGSSGSQPTFGVDANLTNFTIKLIGQPDFIDVAFDHLHFTSKTGSSPQCDVKVIGVTLGQDLGFISDIEKLLDPSEGPFVEFPAGMIRTGFRFAVPETPVGSFLLMQLAFTVSVSLPYDGDPARCDFAISSLDSPFLLSEPPYGGGGFFRILLGLDGVEKLEGALEFGVVADISIGPVSGGGYVVAGIYFSLEGSNSKVCGFVHAHGHLDMFDIAQVDVDVYVSICYATGGSVTGTATITVHVEVLFFSADFQLTATYQFAGSPQSSEADGGDSARNQLRTSSNASPSKSLGQTSTPGADDDCDNVAKWPEYYKYFAA